MEIYVVLVYRDFTELEYENCFSEPIVLGTYTTLKSAENELQKYINNNPCDGTRVSHIAKMKLNKPTFIDFELIEFDSIISDGKIENE